MRKTLEIITDVLALFYNRLTSTLRISKMDPLGPVVNIFYFAKIPYSGLEWMSNKRD